MKALIQNILKPFGYRISRIQNPTIDTTLLDFSSSERDIISSCKPFTMTSIERLASLVDAIKYIVQNQIPGDVVECGVWRGGSIMTIAKLLMANGDLSRTLYLYDTFEGMSEPTKQDKSLDGVSADQQLNKQPKNTGVWCYASLEDVKSNLLSTGYPESKIKFVKGDILKTLPETLPSHLSLLRLDTDWYESTKHELTHLYPMLDTNGILIIDDYGHWLGARKAVDEYFKDQKISVYLHRIDYTGRIVVRNGLN